jgi:hypothetical protein
MLITFKMPSPLPQIIMPARHGHFPILLNFGLHVELNETRHMYTGRGFQIHLRLWHGRDQSAKTQPNSLSFLGRKHPPRLIGKSSEGPAGHAIALN